MKYPGRLRHLLTHIQPMAKILGHIMAAKRKHSHGVAPDLADLSGLGRGSFRGHSRPHKYPVLPVKSLIHQRRQMRPASAKDNRRNRHPVVLLYAKRSRRTIDNRGRETA